MLRSTLWGRKTYVFQQKIVCFLSSDCMFRAGRTYVLPTKNGAFCEEKGCFRFESVLRRPFFWSFFRLFEALEGLKTATFSVKISLFY